MSSAQERISELEQELLNESHIRKNMEAKWLQEKKESEVRVRETVNQVASHDIVQVVCSSDCVLYEFVR